MRSVGLASLMLACTCQAGVPVSGDGRPGDGRPADGTVWDAHAACLDANHDGACDSQVWTCGTKPAAPSDPLFLGGNTNVAGASLAGMGSQLVAAAGGSVRLTYAYGIQVRCGSGTSCPAQIELGFVAGGRQGCLFDGTVGSNQFQGQFGQQVTVTIPSASGVYDLRANIAMNATCGTGTSWSGGQPAADHTFARVCVP